MKLELLYYNPKSPAGYAGEQALYKLAKQSSKKLNFMMFCIIDVFSKNAWVVPIKDKTGKKL